MNQINLTDVFDVALAVTLPFVMVAWIFWSLNRINSPEWEPGVLDEIADVLWEYGGKALSIIAKIVSALMAVALVGLIAWQVPIHPEILIPVVMIVIAGVLTFIIARKRMAARLNYLRTEVVTTDDTGYIYKVYNSKRGPVIYIKDCPPDDYQLVMQAILDQEDEKGLLGEPPQFTLRITER